jgi:predicted house-cleaning noncanonical NTP pyrophosphatase (MazG superfamily)
MEKIYYNKLCRDKIPEIIHGKGFDCDVREVTDDDEYKREIVRKVYEEASGVTNHSGREHMVEEIADLIITLESLKKAFAVSDDEVSAAITRSLEEKGSYDKRLYLSWSSDTEYTTNEKTHGFDD